MTKDYSGHSWWDSQTYHNDPKNWKYSIEGHGDGYALYFGRTPFHHGYNLAHLTEISQETIDKIVRALNKDRNNE